MKTISTSIGFMGPKIKKKKKENYNKNGFY